MHMTLELLLKSLQSALCAITGCMHVNNDQKGSSDLLGPSAACVPESHFHLELLQRSFAGQRQLRQGCSKRQTWSSAATTKVKAVFLSSMWSYSSAGPHAIHVTRLQNSAGAVQNCFPQSVGFPAGRHHGLNTTPGYVQLQGHADA